MSRLILSDNENLIHRRGRCEVVGHNVIVCRNRRTIKLLTHFDLLDSDDVTENNSISIVSGVVDMLHAKWGSGAFHGTTTTGAAAVTGYMQNFNWSGSWTVDVWVRATAIANTRRIFTANSGGTTGLTLYTDTSGRVVFSNFTSGITSSSALVAGTYYNIKLIRDASLGIHPTKLYINGNLEAQGSIGSTATTYPYFTIGGQTNNGSTYFASNMWNGQIDEFRFDNIARTDTSIPTGPYTLSSP